MATYSPTPLSAIDAALKWAKNNNNDIWIAPLRDVAMYIKERNASNVTLTGSTSTSKTYSLTHNISDNVCAYQYPLSLRVYDNGWTNVEVTQGEKKLASTMEDGYIYFDAIPNGGDIVVKISTEDIDNIHTTSTATKRIVNGLLLIEKNGKTINILGSQLK